MLQSFVKFRQTFRRQSFALYGIIYVASSRSTYVQQLTVFNITPAVHIQHNTTYNFANNVALPTTINRFNITAEVHIQHNTIIYC